MPVWAAWVAMAPMPTSSEAVERDDPVRERRADAEPVGEQRCRDDQDHEGRLGHVRRLASRRCARRLRADRRWPRRRAARVGRWRGAPRRRRGGGGSGRRWSADRASTSTVMVPGLRAMTLVMSVTTSSDGCCRRWAMTPVRMRERRRRISRVDEHVRDDELTEHVQQETTDGEQVDTTAAATRSARGKRDEQQRLRPRCR